MKNNYGIFESVQFLNESKSDIIISVNEIIRIAECDESEAIRRVRKILVYLERNRMLTKDGLNTLRNGVNASTIITKGMIKIFNRNLLFNRYFLDSLKNTLIDTHSDDIEFTLDHYLNQEYEDINNRISNIADVYANRRRLEIEEYERNLKTAAIASSIASGNMKGFVSI